jgi:hypothetical protein
MRSVGSGRPISLVPPLAVAGLLLEARLNSQAAGTLLLIPAR